MSNFFVRPTEDLSLVGKYTVRVTAQVTHFTDHNMINEDTRSSAIEFNINMIDPCYAAVLNPLEIKDMKRSVMQEAIIQQVFVSKDDVS